VLVNPRLQSKREEGPPSSSPEPESLYESLHDSKPTKLAPGAPQALHPWAPLAKGCGGQGERGTRWALGTEEDFLLLVRVWNERASKKA
jgi:hypothetical protein